MLLGIINADILEDLLPILFDKLEVYEEFAELQDKEGKNAVLNQAIKMVSFETFNPIKNLGGVYILLIVFFIRFAIFLILWLIVEKY